MIAYVWNIVFLLIYICYAAILAVKNKGTKVNYALVAFAVLLPTFVTILANYGIMLIPPIYYIFFQIFVWLLLCLINTWTCCILYKIFTNEANSLIYIWSHDFRIYNVISCILVVFGVLLHLISYNITYLISLSFYDNNNYIHAISNTDRVIIILKVISFLLRTTSFFVYGVLMIPAVLKKPTDAGKNN